MDDIREALFEDIQEKRSAIPRAIKTKPKTLTYTEREVARRSDQVESINYKEFHDFKTVIGWDKSLQREYYHYHIVERGLGYSPLAQKMGCSDASVRKYANAVNVYSTLRQGQRAYLEKSPESESPKVEPVILKTKDAIEITFTATKPCTVRVYIDL